MREKARFCFCLALVVSVAGLTTAWGQQSSDGELTARDMFRKAAGRLVPAGPKPAAPEPPSPPTPSPAPAPTPSHRTPPEPVSQHDPSPVEPMPISTRPPLGLRYSILKEAPGGGTVEVDSATVFRSGDRIRVTVATTETAYAYVVTKGSSGKWRVLFPSPEIGQGSNLIPGGVIYPIPAGHWFAFDEQVGEEKLFVMVSRTPVKDLDGLIYQLKESGTQPDEPGGNRPPVMMAANIPPVDDSVISHLREEVYARDLVFEKVDDTVPAAGEQPVRAEKAVYIVNKTGANNSRVVADIRLQHH